MATLRNIILRLMPLIEPRPIRWFLALAWTIWITIILIQPEKEPIINTGIPPGPESLERTIIFGFLHLIAFITLTGLWFHALRGHVSETKALLMAGVGAVFLAGFTEWAQSFTPDRYPSWDDFFMNVAGMLIVVNAVRWDLFNLRQTDQATAAPVN